MYEWWDKHFTLLGKSGLNKDVIRRCANDILQKDLVTLRRGVDDFFYNTNKNHVPIVIMSSSIGDLIKEYLKEKNLLLDNIYIIANELSYDKYGKFTKVKNINICNINN